MNDENGVDVAVSASHIYLESHELIANMTSKTCFWLILCTTFSFIRTRVR